MGKGQERRQDEYDLSEVLEVVVLSDSLAEIEDPFEVFFLPE